MDLAQPINNFKLNLSLLGNFCLGPSSYLNFNNYCQQQSLIFESINCCLVTLLHGVGKCMLICTSDDNEKQPVGMSTSLGSRFTRRVKLQIEKCISN